jgi:hypothetical protein
VTLPDGRVAYCSSAQIAKIADPQVVMRPRPAPQVGDAVMFYHPASPRFGQSGVVESIEDGIYAVRMARGELRRANASRLQSVGPVTEPEAVLPGLERTVVDLRPAEPATTMPTRVWRVGDRCRLLPNCRDISVRREDINGLATVTRVNARGIVSSVDSDSGYNWAVSNYNVEPVDDNGVSVEAAE